MTYLLGGPPYCRRFYVRQKRRHTVRGNRVLHDPALKSVVDRACHGNAASKSPRVTEAMVNRPSTDTTRCRGNFACAKVTRLQSAKTPGRRRYSSGAVTHHPVEVPAVREALQLMLAGLLEGQARARNQILDGL